MEKHYNEGFRTVLKAKNIDPFIFWSIKLFTLLLYMAALLFMIVGCYAEKKSDAVQALSFGFGGTATESDANKLLLATGSPSGGSGNFPRDDSDVQNWATLFNGPVSIAYGDNELFIADTLNNTIKKLKLATNFINVFAGSGNTGAMFKDSGVSPSEELEYRTLNIENPVALAFKNDVLYIASHNGRISRLKTTSKSTQAEAEFIGSDTAQAEDLRFVVPSAQLEVSNLQNKQDIKLNHPSSLYIDGNYIFVSDTQNHVVKRFDLDPNNEQTELDVRYIVAGTLYVEPYGITIHHRKLYISSPNENKIYRLDQPHFNNLASATAYPVVGNGESRNAEGNGLRASILEPAHLTSDGRYIFSGSRNSYASLVVLNATLDLKIIKTVSAKDLGLTQQAPYITVIEPGDQLNTPIQIAIDPRYNNMYILEKGMNRILQINSY